MDSLRYTEAASYKTVGHFWQYRSKRGEHTMIRNKEASVFAQGDERGLLILAMGAG